MNSADIRWFTLPSSPAAGGEGLPTGSRPVRRASQLAQAATQLMAAWLANPRNETAAEEDVHAMVRIALAIEKEVHRVLDQPVVPDDLPHRPSPQALAWRAGYLDAEAGRPPLFYGPAELEPDYQEGRRRGMETRFHRRAG
ncbi:hypothetical protein J8J14_01305 [Roseomonas sp. SSH11]|uniref:Uncharacterized protein n=1 Tax=Pararoseomonas baculiformis TaxID=2820812 RepID=A0ABS4A8S7_9PROT|nr:hypothetical protein [Pararoseomonas baculiformis]MBP0443403.1 hypothetical protein [Pararoseomonas baculiformis]